MIHSKFIGERISEARRKISLSQAQLAQKISISPQAIGKWERGESMPDITTFNRLAEILGVDLNYFSESFPSSGTTDTISDEQVASHQTGEGKKKRSWDMSEGNWADADFSGLNNLHEKFRAANLRNCKFIGSDMSGILLNRNYVNGCDFSKAKINNCQLQKTTLSKNVFASCTLKNAEFLESQLKDCDFTLANLTNATLTSGEFIKNTVINTVWNNTSFKDSQISNIEFNGAMDDCSFENCSFKMVTFQNATLTNTFFKNKSLRGIRFQNCRVDKMTYEFLKNGRADLTGITLFPNDKVL